MPHPAPLEPRVSPCASPSSTSARTRPACSSPTSPPTAPSPRSSGARRSRGWARASSAPGASPRGHAARVRGAAGYRERSSATARARRVAVLTSAVRDAANGAAFATAVRERYGLDARTLERRRGGAPDLPRRHRATAPRRNRADGGDRHRRRLDRDRRREPAHACASTSRPRPASCAIPSATWRPTRHGPPSSRRWPATCARDLRGSGARPDPRAHARGHRGRRHRRRRSLRWTGTGVPRTRRWCTATGCPWRRARRSSTASPRCPSPSGAHARAAPDRAPTIVAGVAMLIEALRAFGLDSIEVSDHDILRGAALERRAGHVTRALRRRVIETAIAAAQRAEEHGRRDTATNPANATTPSPVLVEPTGRMFDRVPWSERGQSLGWRRGARAA